MKSQKEKYWLILEPTVEISISKNSVLLYDTLTKNKLIITDDESIRLIKKLNEEGFVISYNNDNNNKQIKIFISQLLDNYMGDIIPVNHSKIKPIQLTNIINIQNDIEKVQKHKGISFTDNIITNLREINIYLNSYKNQGILKDAFKQFLYCSENYITDSYVNYNQLLSFLSNINLNVIDCVNLLGSDISKYYKFKELIMFFSKYNIIINLFFHIKIFIKNIEFIKSFFYENKDLFLFSIFITHNNFNNNDIKKVYSILSKLNINFQFFFTIDNLHTYEQFNSIISKLNINNYSFYPYYNGSNIQFFNDNIFLSKTDIMELSPTQKEININKTINSNFFGKLTIDSNGNIFSYPEKIEGNIRSNNLLEYIINMFNSNSLWFKTRQNVSPCNNCVFNNICPPISNYELYFKKNNLC